MRRACTIGCILLLQSVCGFAQKQINNNVHTWLGLFTTFRVGAHWGVVSDVLMRRNEFVKTPGFYWVRLGGGYWFNNNISLIGAYSNQWLYQPQLTNKSFTYEQRFDQRLSARNRLSIFTLPDLVLIESC